MSTTKDKQIAQLSAQVAALTALVAQTIEQQQAPASKGKAKKAPAAARTGTAWSVFSGKVSKRVTVLKKGYANDERWESETGAEDGCKRAGFGFRVASWLSREYELDDGEGGYLEPEDEQLIEAIEHLLDNPDEQTPTSEARGGMSVTQLKAAGLKIAKPAAKPVAKPVPVKKAVPMPEPAPVPVKKAAPAPEPETEEEAEAEEEKPAPKPKAVKKSPKVAPKTAVLVAAAEVAEEEMEEAEEEAEQLAKALEEPTDEMLKEAGLLRFKHPSSRMWYLRTADEPKKCYLGGLEKEDIAKAWANFKAGICAGIWMKNPKDKDGKGKLDVWPEESSA
jgi:hypothetical protein